MRELWMFACDEGKDKVKLQTDNPITEDIIRPIPGLSGYYADFYGSIWSANNKYKKLMEMATAVSVQGYRIVQLKRDGKSKNTLVHRCVLWAYSGLPRAGQVGRHLDGDRLNNRRDNLKWGTHKENADDMRYHGTNRWHENGKKNDCRFLGKGKGFYYDKKTDRYRCQVNYKGTNVFNRAFTNERDARHWYLEITQVIMKAHKAHEKLSNG